MHWLTATAGECRVAYLFHGVCTHYIICLIYSRRPTIFARRPSINNSYMMRIERHRRMTENSYRPQAIPDHVRDQRDSLPDEITSSIATNPRNEPPYRLDVAALLLRGDRPYYSSTQAAAALEIPTKKTVQKRLDYLCANVALRTPKLWAMCTSIGLHLRSQRGASSRCRSPFEIRSASFGVRPDSIWTDDTAWDWECLCWVSRDLGWWGIVGNRRFFRR